MTISKDLFLSILAMDAYSRGYNSGIANEGASDADGLGDTIGTAVGAATVSGTSSSDPNSAEVAAGFYAVAYTVGTGVDGIAPGTTIISYRGTDGLTLGADPVSGGGDILNGWLAGAGLQTAAKLASW